LKKLTTAFIDAKIKDKGMSLIMQVPARMPVGFIRKIKRLAVLAHKSLGCKDFSRSDFIIDKNIKPYILEVDVHPGFRAMSATTTALRYEGKNLNDFFLISKEPFHHQA
jgi:D-alanine-D-alanine ligase